MIIPTRLLCQMQANSSGAEFLSTISKLMKRMNFLIACLHPWQNTKLGIFTGSRAVDGKEMYKKAWCTCKVAVLPFQAIASCHCCILNFLLFTIHCDPSKTSNILGPNWIAPADSISNVFRLIVPSFLVRKVENKNLPCMHKLVERTGQVWQDNSRHVQTHEKT